LEDQRIFNVRLEKFRQLTKCFHDPEGVAAHKKQVDKDRLRAAADLGRQLEEGEGLKYYPLTPEYWRQGFVEIANLTVLKFPRIL